MGNHREEKYAETNVKMGITKNRLTETKIIELCAKAFPLKKVEKVRELTEGMCNTAYDITFQDGKGCILKVAPADTAGLMTNEVNLMDAEVRAMQILESRKDIRVPLVLFYDDTKTILGSNYFFMSKMEGQNWFTVKESLSDEVNDSLHEEAGKLQRLLAEVKGTQFGMLGDTSDTGAFRGFPDAYAFFTYLIRNMLEDIERRKIEIGVLAAEILEKLKAHEHYFEGVTEASLVHWDMWEGNIFVKGGCISGIIDWERAMWGEPYMDDRFRAHSRCDAFLRGFGKEQFTLAEQVRMRWYDVYLYMLMMAEVTYRQYEDDGQYRWVRPLFDAAWNDVKSYG